MGSFFSKKTFKQLSSEEIKRTLADKDVLVVGGTKGIGAAIVKELSENGAKVTFTGRTCTDETLLKQGKFVVGDVSTIAGSFDLVQNKLNGMAFEQVIFCVGILTRATLTKNSEGIEEDMATSYLSRFVILNELIKRNMLKGQKRVFVYGYPGNNKDGPYNMDDINFENPKTPYKQLPAHINTVFFNDSLVYEIKKRHPEVDIFGLNPGLIQTAIRDNFHGGDATFMGRTLETLIGMFNMSAEEYAKRVVIHLIASSEIKSPCAFFQNGEQTGPAGWIAEEKNRQRLWELSEQLVAKATSKGS